jgi:hypothetical protein
LTDGTTLSDAEWQSVINPSTTEKRATITLTDVEAGGYTFAVKAGSEMVGWSEPVFCPFNLATQPPDVTIGVIVSDKTPDYTPAEVHVSPHLLRDQHQLMVRASGFDDNTPADDLEYCFQVSSAAGTRSPCAEADWQSSDVASYTLSSGAYTITVRAKDGDENTTQHHPDAQSLVFVPPPLYRTQWPLYLLVVGLASGTAGATLGAYRYARGRRRQAFAEFEARMQFDAELQVCQIEWRDGPVRRTPYDAGLLGESLARFERGEVDAFTLRSAGERLFGLLFEGPEDTILTAIAGPRRRWRSKPAVRLRLLQQEVTHDSSHLPWECLYDRSGLGFLTIDADVVPARQPIFGHDRVPGRRRLIRDPLRVLVVVALPQGLEKDTQPVEELRTYASHLVRDLRGMERMAVRTLEEARLDTLSSIVHDEEGQVGYDVLHFVGYDGSKDAKGTLYLEDETGYPVPYSVEEVLAPFSGHHRAPLLGVLDTWPGSMNPARPDVLEAIAMGMFEWGKMQAVVGMQSPISAQNRQVYHSILYETLLAHGQADHATLVARQSLFARGDDEKAEWIAPALYLLVKDGILFEWI